MPSPPPPVARKQPLRIEQLGRTRTDEYAWMKDEAWREVLRDPARLRADVRAHLEAENAYREALMAVTLPLQADLFAEMKGRIREDDASAPAPDGPWEYYVRYETGAQHPLHVRRPRGCDTGEEVLFDEQAAAAGKPFYQVGRTSHSGDHALFAWAADDQGSEYFTIRVKDLGSGKLLGAVIESSTGDFVFSPDSEWLFWVWRDENARPSRVFRSPARGGPAALVYEEADDGMFVSLGTTSDKRHLLIHVGDQETTEIWVIPASDPTARAAVAEPRRPGVKYDLDHWTDRWLIRTNADGALDFKLCVSHADPPARESWRDWVPHRPGRYLAGVAAYADHVVRAERVEALDRLVVTDRSGAEHEIAFEEEAYALSLDGGYEYETTTARFTYRSPTTPRQTFDYDLHSRRRTLRKTQEIPSGHDPSRYVARRLYAPAADGETVPITVLMLNGTPLDGSAPLLLYGYGSYGVALEPEFSIRPLSLVDRGWIWAVAHVRGGSDKGWGWFLDGRGDKKPNSFIDFIACAEHLISAGYGRAGRIVTMGGSAGGLLVGAALNLRPDLWGAVIADVPFVDVLNTMSDSSLPLTPPEWPEWGNPLEDPAAYDLIESYSPYDQVHPAPYPPVLATGGLSDPRVTYWEPAKWVARLRDRTTGAAPILLKINMEAGHGGPSGRFDFLKEPALEYAFAIWAMERTWEQP